MEPKTYKDKRFLETIEALRLPLTVMVMYIHVNPQKHQWYLKWINNSHHSWEIDLYAIVTVVVKFFAAAAVPSFFLFSGFLFYRQFHSLNILTFIHKIKKRLITLGIPYFIWNFIYLMILMAILYSNGKSLEWIWQHLQTKGFWSFFWDYYSVKIPSTNLWNQPDNVSYPVLKPLWFIRDLLVTMILSVLCYAAVKRFPWVVLSIMGMAFISRFCINYTGISTQAIFFYTAGMAMALHPHWLESLYKIDKRYLLTIIIFCLIGNFLAIHSPYNVLGRIGVIAFTLYLISIRIPVFFIWLKQWSSASFFIYAMHGMLILHFFHQWVTALSGHSIGGILLAMAATPWICLIVIVCIFKQLQRFPKLNNLLTGYRG